AIGPRRTTRRGGLAARPEPGGPVCRPAGADLPAAAAGRGPPPGRADAGQYRNGLRRGRDRSPAPGVRHAADRSAHAGVGEPFLLLTPRRPMHEPNAFALCLATLRTVHSPQEREAARARPMVYDSLATAEN